MVKMLQAGDRGNPEGQGDTAPAGHLVGNRLLDTEPGYLSSRSRHTRYWRGWSSGVCSSDLGSGGVNRGAGRAQGSIVPRLVKRPRLPRRAGLRSVRLLRPILTGLFPEHGGEEVLLPAELGRERRMLHAPAVAGLHLEQAVRAVAAVVPARVRQHGVEADALHRDAAPDRLAHLRAHV